MEHVVAVDDVDAGAVDVGHGGQAHVGPHVAKLRERERERDREGGRGGRGGEKERGAGREGE